MSPAVGPGGIDRHDVAGAIGESLVGGAGVSDQVGQVFARLLSTDPGPFNLRHCRTDQRTSPRPSAPSP